VIWLGFALSRSEFVWLVYGRRIIVILEFFRDYTYYFAFFSCDYLVSCREAYYYRWMRIEYFVRDLLVNFIFSIIFSILGLTVATPGGTK
jgi:hypothetical protein